MTLAERIAYFSKIWKQASDVFPYFDCRSIDFDQCYQDFLPKIMAAENQLEYCLTIAEFLNLLGDGHTDFTFPGRLLEEAGFLPFSLIHVENAYYIRSIAEELGQYRWAKVISINGESFDHLLRRAFRYIYHVGNYAYPAKLHAILPFLLRPKDNLMETSAGMFSFDLAKAKPELSASPAADAGLPWKDISAGRLTLRIYADSLLYVNLPDLLYSCAAAEISAALSAHRETKGVILDLRENIGGMTAHGGRIAELFLSGQFHGCRKRTRIMKGLDVSSASQYARMSDTAIEQCIADGLCDRAEVERCQKINANALFEEYQDSFGSEGRRAVFNGSCLILTSRNTISAAEDMTAMFRSNRRAVLIGTPTHGSTGTPLLLPLPQGGGARICSVGYRLLDGTEFIGTGIAPDIPVENSIEDLRRGFDRVLADAVAMLRENQTSANRNPL